MPPAGSFALVGSDARGSNLVVLELWDHVCPFPGAVVEWTGHTRGRPAVSSETATTIKE